MSFVVTRLLSANISCYLSSLRDKKDMNILLFTFCSAPYRLNMKFIFYIFFFLLILTDLITGSVLTRDVPELAGDVAQCDGLLCPSGCCPWGDESYICCPDLDPLCMPIELGCY